MISLFVLLGLATGEIIRDYNRVDFYSYQSLEQFRSLFPENKASTNVRRRNELQI
jgi:type II secretory pathway component PulL